MAYSDDSKKIKVGAVFKHGQIIPKWFNWEGRRYDVKSVNYTWEDRQGTEKLALFAVSAGANTYELQYNSARLTWALNKIGEGV